MRNEQGEKEANIKKKELDLIIFNKEVIIERFVLNMENKFKKKKKKKKKKK